MKPTFMKADQARMQANDAFIKINNLKLLETQNEITRVVKYGIFKIEVDFERSETLNYVSNFLRAEGYKTHFYYADNKVPMLSISW